MGCAERTLDRWFRQQAFPLGKLPNGQWVSTVTLIDTWIQARGILWLKSRLKHRPTKHPPKQKINTEYKLYQAMGMDAPTGPEDKHD
jgi:hypothetical protein